MKFSDKLTALKKLKDESKTLSEVDPKIVERNRHNRLAKRFKRDADPLGLLDLDETKPDSEREIKANADKIKLEMIDERVYQTLDKIDGVIGTAWLTYQIKWYWKRKKVFPSIEKIQELSRKDPTKPSV